MSMSSSPDHARNEVPVFVRRRFDSASALLRAEQEAKTNTLKEDLGNRGFGFALDPLDSRFDDIEIWHCNAVLQAKADALFEAYIVYGLPVDGLIMRELHSHQRQMVDARKSGLKSAAAGRALRTGRNPAPGIARAEELGRKIERSTHAALKGLACEVEKRRHMSEEVPNGGSGPNVTINQNNQNFIGNPTHVTQIAQGDSSSVSTAGQAEEKGKLLKWAPVFAALIGAMGVVSEHLSIWSHQLKHVLTSLRSH
jgi:hypothetical protein